MTLCLLQARMFLLGSGRGFGKPLMLMSAVDALGLLLWQEMSAFNPRVLLCRALLSSQPFPGLALQLSTAGEGELPQFACLTGEKGSWESRCKH